MATYTITAEKMVTGGDCISSIEGKKVFVPLAVPGEKLEVEITKEFRDYSTAKIVSVLEPSSPHRVEPFCPVYGKCGGCNMMHIDYEFQKELRASILQDAFVREGLERPEVEVISGPDRGYRARFQLHSGGLMERQSNNMICLTQCPCATAEVNRYLEEIPAEQRPKGRVHIFGSSSISSIPEGYDKLVIADETERIEKKEQRVENRQRRTPNGRLMKKQKKIKPRFEGTSFNPANTCTIELLGKKLSFDVQGFFQSNLYVLEQAIPKVIEGLSGKIAADIYSGVGTFSVFLADKFDTVCMVEHNRDALAFAEINMVGKKHESFGVSGENWVKNHAPSFTQRCGEIDAAIVDPPRSGMESAVSAYLASSGIPQIRCVSCDAATQARDCARLIMSGYKLEKLFLLDFYPQTCHIESLAWLSR